MSKPVQAINRYKADLRELQFLLFEQFHLDGLLGSPPFSAWGRDECVSSLTECYRWVREVIGPLNALGDAQGCRLEGGKVLTPQGFKQAWKSLYEAGWKQLAVDEQWGGAGAPHALQVLVEEMISGANTAFSMYAGLAFGAAEVIASFGTADQKNIYCPRMFGGQWGGTMCLTEPQAGSDVGSARTSATRTAEPIGEVGYSIRGTKTFISGGDHDLAENIVHLVLARVDGAPPGTKGLTLFIVPKIRPSVDGVLLVPNDVSVANIEHKMGINGSATCTLNFGDTGKCIGWPVGGEAKLNQGMAQMFKLMNSARIAVGVQGISVASSAFLNSLEYAKERRQGSRITHWKDATAPRVPIIEHPDVRRMLIDMKARVEGIRALAVKLAHHQDCARVYAADEQKAAYHQGQVDLLVPLVKAYGSDQGFRVCETAIQAYGGVGYTKDFPVEQYCRDAKIFSIYEGTNHIQAMDLVGRKLGQNGGANLQAFLADVSQFVQKHREDSVLGQSVKALGTAQEALANTAMRLLTWFQTGKVALVPLNANRYLEMMAETTVAWMLLEGAAIALEKKKDPDATRSPDDTFYDGKVAAAQYFARNVLPDVELRARMMAGEDMTAIDLPEGGFGSG